MDTAIDTIDLTCVDMNRCIPKYYLSEGDGLGLSEMNGPAIYHRCTQSVRNHVWGWLVCSFHLTHILYQEDCHKQQLPKTLWFCAGTS